MISRHTDIVNCTVYMMSRSVRRQSSSVMWQLGLHRISYPAPAPAEIRPNFHIRPRPDMRPDMRSDLTIFRCICLTV